MKSTTVMTDAAATTRSVLDVDVQRALSELDFNETEEPPSDGQITKWANAAYTAVSDKPNELTIRLVDVAEITELNRDYRHQNKPTNVLSFPFEIDAEFGAKLDIALLGDVVICHSIIITEAREQGKSVADHYAHMIAHGVLHLCGYDHQDDQTAEQMETLEVEVLTADGIANPYL